MKKKLKEIIIAFLPVIVVYFLNEFLYTFFDIYERFPYSDIPMHILGGISAGWTVHMLGSIAQKRYGARVSPNWVWWLVIVSGVGMFALGWEFYEFFRDTYLPYDTIMQPSIRDTMVDFLMGIIGGVLYVGIIKPELKPKLKK